MTNYTKSVTVLEGSVVPTYSSDGFILLSHLNPFAGLANLASLPMSSFCAQTFSHGL